MCGTFRRISQLWENADTLNLDSCLLYLSFTISQFFDFIQCTVFDFIFYCVTLHTLSKAFTMTKVMGHGERFSGSFSRRLVFFQPSMTNQQLGENLSTFAGRSLISHVRRMDQYSNFGSKLGVNFLSFFCLSWKPTLNIAIAVCPESLGAVLE